MKSAVIIQARVSSTRLPEKALKNLCGRPLISHVIERAKKIQGIDNIILATGIKKVNSPLIAIAESHGIEHYTGPENDVLTRYRDCAKNYECDYIIRITGDNPFTDYESASAALNYCILQNADHCYTAGIPVGTGVEIIRKTALENAFLNGLKPHHREHVTPYIKENPDIFKLSIFKSPLHNPYPDLRLTIDTDKDFALAEILYNALYNGDPIPLTEVIEYVKKNPQVMNINREIKQRPMTHSSGNE